MEDSTEHEDKSTPDEKLLYFILCSSFLLFILTIILLYVIRKERIKVYKLFLEIPIPIICKLHIKCEKLMKKLQYNQTEKLNRAGEEFEKEEVDCDKKWEDEEEIHDQTDELEASLLSLQRTYEEGRKRTYKQAKNVILSNKGIISFLAFSFSIIIAFFIANLYLGKTHLNMLNDFQDFYKQTGIIDTILAGGILFER